MMIGQTISHYKILEKVGEGGMGVVYKARDTKLDRLVALKFLPPHLAADEQDKKRFIHEAKAASALDHPNICTIHEIDELPTGELFIVMALYEGTSLNKKIEQAPLTIEEALNIAIQTAEGLQAAQEKGITHRDIKSSNIMITAKGRAVVMDFGLARKTGATKLTKTGATMGTVPYMSPEQARGEKVDHRTDIWSLGVVLYEMIIGRTPFRGDYSEAIVYQILNEEPEAITSLRSNVPMELERTVKKAMQKDRNLRYQRVEDMLIDLKSLMRETESVSGKTFPVKRPTRGRWYLYASVVVLVLVLGLGVYYFYPREVKAIDSIAVLPLKNLMGDPEHDYFVEGMHEALTAELSKISALKVISRTSAMRYKGTDKVMPQIARELGVEGLIEGSVLREDDKVRITVQLIHGPSDRHLWAESFDRELRGVLALHSDVARAIAREVRIAVTPAEQQRLTRARAVNLEAYEAYLKGRLHVEKMSPEALDTALEYFQLALEKDPNYAQAYVGIGFVWALRGHTEFLPPGEAYAKAKAAVVKALELDNTLSDAHEILALVRTYHDWDWAAGERELQRAIELNPNYAGVRSFYSLFLIAMQRPQEARVQIERALELDPYNSFFHYVLGVHLAFERRYDEALPQLRKAAAMQPDGIWPPWALSIVFHQKRMHREALAETKEFFALRGDREVVEALERGFTEGGYARALKLAAETLAARSQRTYASPIYTAFLFARAGEKDRALEWLEQAYRTRSGSLAFANVAPDWNPLRDDPHFQDLLRRMKFPEDQTPQKK